VTTMTRSEEPYVMGRTAGEYERLIRQARQLEPFAAAQHDRADLVPGMRCLDVGCGPGEVMRLMAERVGPRGAVVGIDLDGALGANAQARLHALGHTQATCLEGDVLTLSKPDGAPFDLVYTRLVLIHAPDPLAVLRRMSEWTAPGGAVLVQDFDLDAVASDPPLAVVDEFRRATLGVFERARRPLDAGTQLRRQFIEAGLGTPDATGVDGFIYSMEEARGYIEGASRSVLPLALEWGLTTATESETWFATLASSPDDATFRFPLTMSALRRKPR